MKRIAIVFFVLSFVASPARADGIRGAAGTLGMGGISTLLCLLTVIYGPDDAESSSEGFDRRGFFLGVEGGFAVENFSERPMNEIGDIFSNQPQLDVPILAGPSVPTSAAEAATQSQRRRRVSR